MAKGLHPQDFAKKIFLRTIDFCEFMPVAEKIAQAKEPEVLQSEARVKHLRLAP